MNQPRISLSYVGVCFVSLLAVCTTSALGAAAEKQVIRYVRFQRAGAKPVYGILEGDRVRELAGDLFGKWSKTDKTYPLAEVKLLVPTRPSKVLAMAGNYKTHLGGQPASSVPEVFFKVPSALIPTGGNIVIPKGTSDVHYEGEMVIVIGKRTKNVPAAKALDYVLGVTCGNDVSARDWQKNDKQWWRAKGSDTFGPCGPCIASGLNYDDLKLQLRLNGEVKQEQRTSDLIHNVARIVSWISQYVTLLPGDLIYTGTPGKTSAIKPGDEVEVELEGVGVLKNKVVARRRR
jgi:2-keto-4-pentenoate hydratase/2-oxohepta-3-ene-1,7-dioic acid hydratase in catechol pathway